MKKITNKFITNLSLILISLFLSVLIAENILRIFYPIPAVALGKEIPWVSEYQTPDLFTLDKTLGFRPIIDSPVYNKWGVLHNNYGLIPKTAEKQRLLFIGDSITLEGFIIEGLKKYYNEDKFEYWNAGIGSYNTLQEIEYYYRYNQNIKPDHIILTFHMNDFENIPIVFKHKGKIVAYSHNLPLKKICPYLFKISHLYRLWVKTMIAPVIKDKQIKEKMKTALKGFKKHLKDRNIALTVLIHPTLLSRKYWKQEEKENHAYISQTLKELGIRYFDLDKYIEKAISKGIFLHQKMHDYHHPSRPLATFFAEHLHKENIFETEKTDKPVKCVKSQLPICL